MMPQGRFESEKIRKSRLKAFKLVAVFADRQYQQISGYIKSDVFEEQKRSAVESKKQLDKINSTSKDRDVQKSVAQLRNQSKVDDSLVKAMVNRENRYLILAVKYVNVGCQSYTKYVSGKYHVFLAFGQILLENVDRRRRRRFESVQGRFVLAA